MSRELGLGIHAVRSYKTPHLVIHVHAAVRGAVGKLPQEPSHGLWPRGPHAAEAQNAIEHRSGHKAPVLTVKVAERLPQIQASHLTEKRWHYKMMKKEGA